MRLILVRHGETPLNREGRVQGHNNDALNTRGREQAEDVAQALWKERPFALYTSPILRARQVAETISRANQIPLVQVDGLKEVDAGELEGLTGQEMRQRYPEFMRQWAQDAASCPMPGGESLAQVQERAWRAVMEMVAEHPSGKVVAVTHNFTIHTIVCKALGLPLNNFRRLRHDLGSMTTLDMEGEKATLVYLNDRCHLRPQDPGEGG